MPRAGSATGPEVAWRLGRQATGPALAELVAVAAAGYPGGRPTGAAAWERALAAWQAGGGWRTVS